MSNFKELDRILDKIIRREGGFVNHPNDPGGATKYGITKRTLEAYLDREVSIDEVRDLELNTAKKIYANNYFYKPKINDLPTELWDIVMDMAVNHGSSRGIKILQEAIHADKDGFIGQETIRKSYMYAGEDLYNLIKKLVQIRKTWYNRIIELNPKLSVFRRGWMRRAEEFLED